MWVKKYMTETTIFRILDIRKWGPVILEWWETNAKDAMRLTSRGSFQAVAHEPTPWEGGVESPGKPRWLEFAGQSSGEMSTSPENFEDLQKDPLGHLAV